MISKSVQRVCATAFFCIAMLGSHTLTAATFTVTNTADSGAGSLRAAIIAANFMGGSNSIVFTIPANSTITVTSALPAIITNVTIDGGGASNLTLSGGNTSNIFQISTVGAVLGPTVEIKNLTLANGKETGADGTVGAARSGGGGGEMGAGGGVLVLDNANVTITNVNFIANSAVGGAGAIGGINTIAVGSGGTGGGALGGLGGLAAAVGLPGAPGVFGSGGGGGGGGIVGLAGIGGAGVLGGGSGGSGSGILAILPGTISPGYGGNGGGGVVNGGGGGGGGGGAIGGAVFVAATSTISFSNVSMNGNTATGGVGGAGTSGGGNGNNGQAAGAGLFLTTGGTFAGGSYNDQISGVGPAIIASGTTIFSGVNSYTGNTVLNGGTLLVNSNAALGDAASNIVFNGGTLKTTANMTSNRLVGLNVAGGTIDTNGTDDTFGGVFSGLGGLTKAGNGTLTLSAFNLFVGQTTINGGTIAITNMVNIGLSTSIGMNGGTLRTDAPVNIGQSIILGSSGGTINTNGNNSFLLGAVTGTGGFTKDGAGTLLVSGINTYTGSTTVLGGMLVAGLTNTFDINKMMWVEAGASFSLGGFNQMVGSLAGGGNVIGGFATLTAGGDNTSTTFSGVLSGGGAQLVKNGSGTLTLSGTNTYGGGTEVASGMVSVSSAGNLGTGNVKLDGTILQITGNTTLTQNVVLNGGGTIDTGTNSDAISGIISGNGGLTKNGSGVLALTGTNTYTGGTNVTGGTLKIDSAANLGSGGVNLSNASVLLNGSTTLAQSLAISNGSGVDTGINTGVISSGITGSGGFIKNGAGTLTLANNNSFSGALNVGAGTLVVTGTNAYTGGTTIGNGATLSTATASNLGGGGIALNGGTLDLTGATTVAQNMTVTNTGTINTQANVDTVSSNISGSGMLVKDGAGTLNLSGTNTYTGGTQVLDGILKINNAGNVGAGTITLDDATLQFANATTLSNAIALNGGGTIDTGSVNQTLFGAVSGTGGLTKIGTGVLNLLGRNSYSGGTEVTAGTLSIATPSSIGTGTLTLDGATLRPASDFTLTQDIALVGGGTIDTNGHNDGIAGIISGAGGLIKKGSGMLTLSAANTYSGLTNVNAGALNLANATLGGDVNVASVAALLGSGTINGRVINSGVVTPGIGTSLNVNGNYIQNIGATLMMNVSPIAAAQLNVGNAATLSGKLGVNFAPGNYLAATYRLLNANVVIGKFSDVLVLNKPIGFESLILYDPNDVSVVLRVPAPTDTIIMPHMTEVTINDAHAANNMLMDCLENSRGGSSCAPSSARPQDAMRLGYMENMPIVKGIVTNLPDVMARYGGWFRGYGSMGSMGSDGSDAGYDDTAGGFMAGIDKKITRHIALGIAGGYSHTLVTQRDASTMTSTLDTPRAMLYGSYRSGDIFVDANIGYAHNGTTSQRSVLATGQTATADYVTHEANAGIQVSKSYTSGNLQLMPKLGMSYAHLMQDAYTEDGAPGYNLNVMKHDTDTLRPYVGASIMANFKGSGGMVTTPSFHVKYSREVLNVSTNRQVNVLGTDFLIEGTKPPKNIFSLGSGLTAKMNQNLDLFVEYNADIYPDNGTGIQHTIAAGFRKMF